MSRNVQCHHIILAPDYLNQNHLVVSSISDELILPSFLLTEHVTISDVNNIATIVKLHPSFMITELCEIDDKHGVLHITYHTIVPIATPLNANNYWYPLNKASPSRLAQISRLL